MIQRMNEIGKRNAMEFFREHGLLDEQGHLTSAARQYQSIEIAADEVHRGMSPRARKEFKKRMELGSERAPDEHQRRWRSFLENYFWDILSEAGLLEASPCEIHVKASLAG